MTRLRLAGLLASGVLALTVAAVPPVTAGAAGTAEAAQSCQVKGQPVYLTTWTGGDGDWSDATWSSPGPPGAERAPTSRVCITGAVTVTIGPESGRVDLASLVLADGATLRVGVGAGLFVWNDDKADFSLVRAGSEIQVSGGTLGGPGKLLVRGLVTLAPEGGQPASLGTSDDFVVPSSGGRLVLDDQGRLRIDGSVEGAPASRMTTAYDVKVRGTVTITGEGSLAADHGTSFALVDRRRRPGAGTLEIENELGYAEGALYNGLGLSTFSNQGVIRKSGPGVSRIAAEYSASGGSSTMVDEGSLLLPDGTMAGAVVAPGATYGSGACDEETGECGVGTTEERQQVAWLTIPSRDKDGATVVVTPVDADKGRSVGSVIEAHAQDLDVSRRAPAVLQLRYDGSLLKNTDGSYRTWRDLDVTHQGDNGSYHLVVPCTKGGEIPVGEVACVDRGGHDGSSRQVDDDVVMVVLTTVTSRWRVP